MRSRIIYTSIDPRDEEWTSRISGSESVWSFYRWIQQRKAEPGKVDSSK